MVATREERGHGGWILWTLIVATIGGTGLYLFLQLRIDPVAAAAENSTEMNTLIVVESEGMPLYTHVILFNPIRRRIGLVDIPGDLGVVIPQYDRIDRIDTIYRDDGLDAYSDRISRLIDRPIDYALSWTPEQLSAFVDLLGGLRLFVHEAIEEVGDQSGFPSEMSNVPLPAVVDSVSPSQAALPPIEAVRLVPAGSVLLDGTKTVQFATHRPEGMTELERVDRAWAITEGIFDALVRRNAYWEDDRLRELAYRYTGTNIDSASLASLLALWGRTDQTLRARQRVLGDRREVEVDQDVKELLFPHYEGQLLRDAVRQVVAGLASEESAELPASSIAVEILNGTDRNGLAGQTRELFRGYGFAVVRVGNYVRTDIAATKVYDRTGRTEVARRVADIIGVGDIESGTAGLMDMEDVPVDRQPDVTVVLGADFDGVVVREQ